MKRFFEVFFLAVAGIGCSGFQGRSPLFKYNTTVEGINFHCFRIPGLVWTEHYVGRHRHREHRLVAFAEARQFWGDGCSVANATQWEVKPVMLVMRTSDDAGVTWAPAKIIGTCGFITCGPSAVYDAVRKQLVVQYRTSLGGHSDNHCHNSSWCDSLQIVSKDGGETFEPQTKINDALGDDYRGVEVGPGKGLQLKHGSKAGRLMFVGHKEKYGPGGTALWVSDDGGVAWHLQYHWPYMNEAQLAEVKVQTSRHGGGGGGAVVVGSGDGEGTVIVLLRNNNTCACLATSTSTDGGETWSTIKYNPKLTNPTAQADIVAGSDGTTLYVSTPYSSNHSLQGHNNLSILTSTDVGETWSEALWSVGPDVQSSYSSMAMRDSPDGPPLNIMYESEAEGCDGPSCSIVLKTLPFSPPAPPPPPSPPPSPSPPRRKKEVVAQRSVSYGCSHGNNCIQSSFLGYNWTAITTVVTFTATNLTELCTVAKSHGVKVVWNRGKFLNTSMLFNASYTSDWIQNVTGDVASKAALGVYGLNLDIEHFRGNVANGSAAEREQLTRMVCTIQSELAKVDLKLFSIDVKIWADASHFDLRALSECAEYLVPMGYDMVSKQGASSNAPLPVLLSSIQQLYIEQAKVPPSKIILGLPFYGYSFPCSRSATLSAAPPASSSSSAAAAALLNAEIPACRVASPTSADWQVGIGTIFSKIEQGEATVIGRDSWSQSPYIEYNETKHPPLGRMQVWYEDAASLAIKVGLVEKLGLGGAAFWSVEGLTYASPAADAIDVWSAVVDAV